MRRGACGVLLTALTVLTGCGRAGDEVEVHPDIAYRDGPDADPERHRLDLYLPRGKSDFPVLVFVHGGAWEEGGKREFVPVGRALAADGIGVACVNYRLYPTVKFPANAADVARAFAWVHANVGRYGGRTDKLFIGGHSAGGQLAALLACDASYLKAEGLAPDAIAGVIGIGGVYSVKRGWFAAFKGDGDEALRNASPTHLVRGKAPPFLLVYADDDLPGFAAMSEELAEALRKHGGEATCLNVPRRNHNTVAFKIAEDGDPVRRAIGTFVAGLSGPGRPAGPGR